MVPRTAFAGGAVQLLKERLMVRKLAVVIGQMAILILLSSTSVSAAQAQFGTESEARTMLEKAVVALKEDKEKALGC